MSLKRPTAPITVLLLAIALIPLFCIISLSNFAYFTTPLFFLLFIAAFYLAFNTGKNKPEGSRLENSTIISLYIGEIIWVILFVPIQFGHRWPQNLGNLLFLVGMGCFLWSTFGSGYLLESKKKIPSISTSRLNAIRVILYANVFLIICGIGYVIYLIASFINDATKG